MSGDAGGGPLVVISAHAGDIAWRADHTDPARRRGTQLRRSAGPNLGLAHTTMAETYMRVHPQVTGVLA